MEKQKEKEFFMVIMVIDMKVNGEMIKKKEKEFICINNEPWKGDRYEGE